MATKGFSGGIALVINNYLQYISLPAKLIEAVQNNTTLTIRIYEFRNGGTYFERMEKNEL